MTATISKRIQGRWVPFIRTDLFGIALRRFMERRRRGEVVQLEVRQ